MLKHIRNVLAAVALPAMAIAPVAAQEPIKIGFMATFSGPIGALGQDQYDGFMLAVDERGGKLGGVPVKIIKEDDQFKPDIGAQIVTKLIEREKVPIITGITASNVVMAVAKTITDKKVFLLSTNSGPSPLAGANCSPYQYVVSFQGEDIAEVVGKYATDKQFKRVVLMAPNYQGGKDLLAGFKRAYKGLILDEIYTPLSQLDFSTELTQVAAAKADAVFAFYPGAMGINFVRQYQQAGLLKTLPLLSTGIIDGTSLPALKTAALGALLGMEWGPDLDNAANKKFVEQFERKFKRIPSNLAAQGYDGALLLDSAIAKVKGNMADKAAFAAALKAADFKSVRGKFKFNNNNFPIQDLHIFEAANDAKGRVSMRKVATPLVDHQDAYHTQCVMRQVEP
ncbi:ABC transporter substrate-binding protein [Herbaspirillum autotrophicum]|uniref:ABC transporter substrate-binding protein n=1 Tax=Herbaspirillum autotrophicum TaxID=180195 RepID=UPI00067B4D42|nr:ABC transporter substrate-binding protein [Herbaspirillum autotrophicum]